MIASTATIHIKSKGKLESVATKLQDALMLPPFWFDSDMDPPHAITAMTECLGYEIWLTNKGAEFELKVEASVFCDRAEGSLVDLSEWLAMQVSIVSDLECTIKRTYSAAHP
jgi:hypothetical protein